MIPVCEPLLGESERAYVDECISTGWISSAGTFIDRFESAWAAYCGTRFGVAVSSGTAALHVAAACLELQPGDEVVMPSFTIISCVTAVLATGATPVLVDCDRATWCLDVEQAEARVGPRTRAILPVHIYGHPVDMDRVRDLANRHGLAIIEDAAEAHGAEYRGVRTGNLGDLGCFSFYANKIVTTGEGGMLVTNDADLAQRARGLRNLGFRSDRRFYHTELGSNYRLTNMQAALGVAQLESIEERLRRKREIAHRYTELLGDVAGLRLPVEMPWARNVYWMYGLVLDQDLDTDARSLAARLRELGVDTRPFFLGMHEQPVLRARGLFEGETYPVTEELARRGLYLPSGFTLTDAQIEQVADAVRKAIAR